MDRSGSHIAGYNWWLERTAAKVYLFTHPDLLFPVDTVRVAYKQAQPSTYVAFKCFWLSPDMTRDPTDPNLKPKGYPREDFFLYLGSVAAHKGVHRTGLLANALGAKLIVAGPASGKYADQVAMMPGVEMVGEVGDPYRSELLEKAFAVMCLHGNENSWYEPGCGVVGEAGAFNTPVAALPNGCLGSAKAFGLTMGLRLHAEGF